MADNHYTKTTLRNGLRIISVPSQNTKAVTVLAVVGAGSKYETKANNGISHFLEHMFFKGTRKRPTTLKISEALDKVGGEYNAFTAKEFTGYYAKVACEHFDLALDWVSDIFLNSKLENKEINREKGVILEELNMYLDTPIKYVAELWEKLLYGNQPAGWPTIGTQENILRFTRKHFVSYLNSHYSALNTIVCLSGNFKQRGIEKKVSRYFKKISKKPPQQKVGVFNSQDEPQLALHFKKTDQTHFCLGVKGFDLFDEQKYAQEVLSVILGGNMSSRLFIQVRERRGLAYYIHSSSQSYTDSGYLLTQAGVANQHVKKAISLILKEYGSLARQRVSQLELKKAKDYIKGSLILNLESSDEKASFYGGQELLTGKILTAKEKFAMIDKITVGDIKRTAQEIFKPENLNLALIGPHKDKASFQRLLSL